MKNSLIKLNTVAILALLVMLGSACAPKPTSFKIIKDGEGVYLPFVMAGGERVKVKFDDKGEFNLDVSKLEIPFIVRYHAAGSVYNAYVSEGSAQVINISKEEAVHTGDNKEYAEYLNNRQLINPELLKTDSESEAIEKVKSAVQQNIKGVQVANLDDEFTIDQEITFTYIGALRHLNWVKSLPNKDELQETSISLQFINEMLSQKGPMNATFKSFASAALEFLVWRDKDDTYQLLDFMEDVINLTINTIQRDGAKDIMMNYYVGRHIKYEGVNGMKSIVDLAKNNMSDDKEIEKLLALYAKWEHLEAGKPVYNFTCNTIDGEKMSLSDFKGKYVYIDLWATWCGPCVKEIPYIQEFEKEFHGEDIVFVSISSDEKVDKWKKKVLDDQLKGVQLHDGGDKEFAKFMIVTGIPRFILIGKNGEMVNAKCPKPSNARTRPMLIELLKN